MNRKKNQTKGIYNITVELKSDAEDPTYQNQHGIHVRGSDGQRIASKMEKLYMDLQVKSSRLVLTQDEKMGS